MRCSPREHESDPASVVPEVSPTRESLVGAYVESAFHRDGTPAPGFPIMASLRLMPDGGFDCMILNGITADGCGTFEGAGTTGGRWTYRDGTVTLEPRATREKLAISLAGAVAQVRDGDLVFQVDGRERWLVPAAKHTTMLATWGDCDEEPPRPQVLHMSERGER